MNTNAYMHAAIAMPLESTGMFFIPAYSTNIPVNGFSIKSATALIDRGLQSFFSKTIFQHIPVAPECSKKSFAQQIRELQAASTATFQTFQTFQTADAFTHFLASSQALIPDFAGLINRAAEATASHSNHPQKELRPCK